jgi:hypothetical protein
MIDVGLHFTCAGVIWAISGVGRRPGIFTLTYEIPSLLSFVFA